MSTILAAGSTNPSDPSPIDTLLGQPVALSATGIGGTASGLVTAPLQGYGAITPTPALVVRALVVATAGTKSSDIAKRIGSRALTDAMNASGWGSKVAPSTLPDPAVIDAVGNLWRN